MKLVCRLLVSLSLLAMACSTIAEVKKGPETATATPTAAEQLEGLGKTCADTAEARQARYAEQSLYKSLGGEARIKKFTTDFVGLHYSNPVVAPFFRNTDRQEAAARGAQWLITNSGGPKVYAGPSLQAVHGRMKITPEAFLAAGGDVQTAMKSNGYTEEQIQDVLCLLGSHISEVVAAQ